MANYIVKNNIQSISLCISKRKLCTSYVFVCTLVEMNSNIYNIILYYSEKQIQMSIQMNSNVICLRTSAILKKRDNIFITKALTELTKNRK